MPSCSRCQLALILALITAATVARTLTTPYAGQRHLPLKVSSAEEVRDLAEGRSAEALFRCMQTDAIRLGGGDPQGRARTRSSAERWNITASLRMATV